MSLTNTNTTATYVGDGAQVNFPINFVLFDNTQVVVSKYNTVTDITTPQVLGVDYTLLGGNPANAVLMTTPPTSDEELTVYRVTTKQQVYDFVNNATNFPEQFEAAIDRIVMMVQELAGPLAPSGGAGWAAGASQTLASGDTVSINTSAQRQYKKVQGDTTNDTVFADSTTPVQNGVTDGQELRLVGGSSSQQLIILQDNASNIVLNGDITFMAGVTLDLFWIANDSKWVETARSE